MVDFDDRGAIGPAVVGRPGGVPSGGGADFGQDGPP